MEQARRFHALGPSEMRGMGKRGSEWDLNDWKWDGDLFIATRSGGALPSNYQGQQFIPVSGNSSNSSTSCSDDVHSSIDDGRRESERKRRVIVVEEDSLEEAGSLTLKLGGNCFPVSESEREVGTWEGTSGKKTAKLVGGSSNRAVCQVEDCGADLTKAKDYHRRHKVCEMHSKASKALVGNVMQRFCQQCSRFHVLQEFDEGKRSCRRRLAGHNKRRRKTQPDTAVHGNSINDEQTNNVLLMSLPRILSDMHANNKSDQSTDQDLVAQLLRSLANPSGLHVAKGLHGLLHESHKLLNGGMANGNGHSEKMSDCLSNDHLNSPQVIDQHDALPDSAIPRKELYEANSRSSEMQVVSSQDPGNLFPIKDSPPAHSETTAGRMKLNNFDLNDAYVDSDDGIEDLERSPVDGHCTTGSVDFPSWAGHVSHQSSPPQTNSDSASAQSPSSSSGEPQCRTDRIVFKLFGKEPGDFPMVLRGQILDWLAHSPTDIESYIRPGCIILTIYLRLAESSWEELCSDLSSCLTRLFDISEDTFWSSGWVYVRVQNQIACFHNGQVILDTTLSLQNSNSGQILSIMPIAVSMDERAEFEVRGFNLSGSTTRLLCALEGKYLDQEATQESKEDGESVEEDDETEHATMSCVIPKITGRGYIEVEDHGLSSSFFPFIVAEKNVCSEIRTLESVLELKEADEDAYEVKGTFESRRLALDFINEMGWLLHRSHLKSRLADLDPNTVIFSFRRFTWLMDFSIDHDWCAVIRKLLDVLVDGTVGSGEHPSLKVAMSQMGLLHKAVRKNSRSMVELLLKYVPDNLAEDFISTADGGQVRFMFRPDAQGPAGLTPLHVAAGRDGSEDVLDALLDDPGKIGIDAWKNARDSTGATPEDYARMRGQYAYIHMVQRKIQRSSAARHVVLDIPVESSVSLRHDGAVSFEVGRNVTQSCKLCDQKMSVYYRSSARTSLVYRPAMLSMVAIAAVCMCVALLFKSMPNVVCLFQPFRWESLNYGPS
ncbi:squamosa promoter-binding-like protein 1 [Beta vulgaris subsp. vulgaris]|uniref:squamosa promoter-binding-like protein 1 n=1 Tax=Beta vulgaris subsp. vulgaris TaxID=3555 RepID=UPI00203750C0|nr:squamosa promoter-binding-like protein 1 [Beta vulgaris subsp. vulgaris]XP_010694792.2 squamosa promoter-binding-like protein 1 [Beta vulgaris subsp. vulgaris]XP_048499140.1 squamosa promoter-binding-like protein 1 [Beta vulgaris subsp. vulgaris]XP_048499141.1 squamosa promoter-binding-like protein 1 [Beta vulgaris subsp. vulgaris]